MESTIERARKPVVAVIGAGGWGKNIVHTLAGIDACELRYICDLKKPVLAAHRKLYPWITATADFHEVLDDAEVQGVLVAVDAPHHYKIARAALEARKHTFVEKPLTLSIEDAASLVDVAKEKGVKLMVGHLLLYHPAVLLIREMIDRGELGQILYLYSQRVNLGIVRQGENAWWSLAPHDVSVAQFLLGGHATAVMATGQCFLQPRLGVEDVVFASIKFDNGTMAHIHTSWLDPHKIRCLTVVGTRKMVVFDDMQASEKLRIYDKSVEVRPGYVDFASSVSLRLGDLSVPAIPNQEPLQTELLHFLEAIAGDISVRSDGRNGLEVVRVLVAGDCSLKRGGALVEVVPRDKGVRLAA